jgi:hypothetical protein
VFERERHVRDLRPIGAGRVLLLVSLDDRRRTHLGLVRILAKLAPCVPLAQKIPALIELDLDLLEPHLIVIRQLALPVQVLLLMHKAFDLLQD